MSWLLGALRSLHAGGHAPLDALVSETYVARALEAEGLHVARFGLWALRRHARREDPIERLLRQPKDWTWLIFAPLCPHDLSARDAELLARLAHGLHGVQFLYWSVAESSVTFTAYSVRTTVVRGVPILLPSSPRPEGTLSLPVGPLLPDLTRWASVPEARLTAALIEGAYVERVAGAERGAFTNVDVLALDGGTPVVVEVKRRVRSKAHAGDPVTMTVTQAGTLGHLAAAGAEVHVAILVSPTGSACHPDEAIRRGRWQAGAPLIRPGWGEMHVDLWGAAEPVSLATLRRAREVARPSAPVQATQPITPPAPDRRVRRSSGTPVRPFLEKGSPARGSLPARLPEPRRLTSFSFEYAFLRPWTPAPIRLGGRLYPTPAAAFLAARTLDAEVRDALTGALTPGPALQFARHAPVRLDWTTRRDGAPVLREEVASAVVRAAFRAERGEQLVATLPFLLADLEAWGPALDGLQGAAYLHLLHARRGELAAQQATGTAGCCGLCAWARPGPWPGFARCEHQDGEAGTLACVGKKVCRGPGGAALVALTTRGGPGFRSKQATHRP